MLNAKYKIGFSYFSSPEYLVSKELDTWMPNLSQLGASMVIFSAGFDRAIPEDAFISAGDNGLEPIVHLTSKLPLARKFNDVAILMDVYAKWGVDKIILGDKPNTKNAWPKAGWHYENLVDHFLDRFIPLATRAVQVGLNPVFPPLAPGGDYWDTAFLELILLGLSRRHLDDVIQKLILSSYGYTFNQPLTWGKGGPERWSASKPYLTPEGQEDQMGFHNFEWNQAMGQRTLGKEMPVIILNAGRPGNGAKKIAPDVLIEDIQQILKACKEKPDEDASEKLPEFNEFVIGCNFSLDTLDQIVNGKLSFDDLQYIFGENRGGQSKSSTEKNKMKMITHYLLLPSHKSGVSDAVLNKVLPFIKKLHPTVGFSLEEATYARKVSVYPDSILFKSEQLDYLRSEGCFVEVLPQSGIDIATNLQES